MGVTYEVIFVDDGSRDNSAVVLAREVQADPNMRLVRLIRNFGQHQAITAGLAFARGAWVVLMDDDLQNPPEEIPKLYTKAGEGYDVIYGTRLERADGLGRKVVSRVAHRLLCWLFGEQAADAVSGFRILSRRVVQEYLHLTENHTYVAALIAWMGFPHASVPVRHDPRRHGRSGYSYVRLLRIWLNIAFGFSLRPLKLATWVGLFFSLIAFLLTVRAVLIYFTANEPLMGYTSLFAGQMMFFGITMIFLGVIGEYLGRISVEVKGRPCYILDREKSVPPVDASFARKEAR
jgi:dolichol-phosphate mannosyltransferase